MLKEAIILSGGKGSRLQGITKNKYPKGLARVKKKSLLYWNIHWLSNLGVNKIILATGFLSEVIKKELGSSIIINDKEIDIVYSVEKEKLGSGGAIKLASKLIEGENCFVVNGDILTDIPGKEMITQHLNSDMLATMMLVKLKTRYGVVKTKNNIITKFIEKPTLPVYIHSGIDIIKSSILERFPEKGQMEESIFIELANERKFGSYLAPDGYYWEAIDTPKELETANSKWNPKYL